MHLNPYAPLYYPSQSAPPPPHIRTTTFIYYFPPHPPFSFLPFPGTPLLLPAASTQAKAKKERLVWVPKEKSCESPPCSPKFLSATPVAPPLRTSHVPIHLDFCFAAPELLMKGTTIMIKNIPNKLTRELLIEMMDQHCAEQQRRHDDGEKSFVAAEYDFVYLPMDFSTQANKGYAFVNFTTAKAARKAYEQIQNRKWIVFNSNKVARVCFARVQGKTALVNRFKCTQFKCDSDEFLPATFTPPRNGSMSLPSPDNVGKRIYNPLPLKHSINN